MILLFGLSHVMVVVIGRCREVEPNGSYNNNIIIIIWLRGKIREFGYYEKEEE